MTMAGDPRTLETRAYQASFLLASEAAAFVDADGIILAANPAFLQLFGEQAQEGCAFTLLFSRDDRDSVETFLRDGRRWSEASLTTHGLEGMAFSVVDLRANQFVDSAGKRHLLVRARSADARLEAERLHEAAVLAARACNEATSWPDLSEGAERVLRRVFPRLIGAGWLRRDGDGWIVAHSFGELGDELAPGRTFADASLWGRFARQGESILIIDASLELRGEQTTLDKRLPQASLILSPIVARDQAEGLLAVAAAGVGSLSLEDMRCLDALAREMGSAARRLEDHEALARSHAKLGEAFRANQELLARIRRLNAELEEFSLWTTHDLREPLRGLATLADLLAEEATRGRSQDVPELAHQLSASATRLKEDIRALHEFHETARDSDIREPVVLAPLVEAVAQGMPGAVVKVEEDAAAARTAGDAARLRRALADILRFAAARQAGLPPIEVGIRDASMIRVSVPLSAGAAGRAAELAFRIVGTEDSLALARRIALQHGGALHLGSDGGAPEIVLLLPKES